MYDRRIHHFQMEIICTAENLVSSDVVYWFHVMSECGTGGICV